MQTLYDNFLSGGFAELNVKGYNNMVDLYDHNYRPFMASKKEARVLDIGCGMGQFLTFAGQVGYVNQVGVDVSKEAVAFCHEKGIGAAIHITDLVEYLKTSEQFDVIVMNDVIEHLPKDEIVLILKLIKEKLHADGRLIVKTGNLSSMVGPKIRYNDFTHTCGFTEFSLNQVMVSAGFNEIQILPFIFPRNSIVRWLRYIGQKIAHGLWKAIFFLEYTKSPDIVDELIFAVAKK